MGTLTHHVIHVVIQSPHLDSAAAARASLDPVTVPPHDGQATNLRWTDTAHDGSHRGGDGTEEDLPYTSPGARPMNVGSAMSAQATDRGRERWIGPNENERLSR